MHTGKHTQNKDENFWKQEFRGEIYFSHGESNARGVAILVSPKSEINVLNRFQDFEGRMVGIHYEHCREKFILVNIYAPNKDSPEFFLNVFKEIEKYEGKRIIVGDFNFTMNCEIDRSDPKASNNDHSAEMVKQYAEDTYMTDVWRDRNPDKRTYTYCRSKPFFIGSRIDLFLTEISLNAWIKEVKIIPGFKTDHSAMIMIVKPHSIERGRGLWRMNAQILYEIEYLKSIKNTFLETLSLH